MMADENYSQKVQESKPEPEPKKKSGCLSCFLNVLIAAVLIAAVFFGIYYYRNCRFPVRYAVGNVDQRFKITKDEVIKVAKDAEGRWDNAAGKNYLEYDENAPLKINLIYDERQAELDQFREKVGGLNVSKGKLDTWQNQFETMFTEYKSRLAAYNKEVDSWNSQGGAPADIYARLQKESQELDSMRQELEDFSKTINLNVDVYNSSVDELKQETEKKKNQIITQGQYNPSDKTINIYTFGDEKELRLVLMHEDGHALGIEHVENPQSIMYYILGEQNLDNPLPSEQDLAALSQTCSLDSALNYRKYFPITQKIINAPCH